MINVDIATKIISPQTAIWVVFPGRGRRFINTFLGQGMVFLETPAIGLTKNITNDLPKIRQHTRMSLAMADYVRGDGGRVPSRNPTAYSEEPFRDNSHRVLASNVRKMFGKMKTGDLVVVPGRMFMPVYFGEVTSEFEANDTISVERYADEKTPFRHVRWLNEGVPRHLIPTELQVYISKPPAISLVVRSFQTENFFKLAYRSFVLAEKSAVIMDGPRYNGKNPLATHEANYLISYFISAFSAIELERLDEFAKLDIRSAIARFYDEKLVESFTQNFNSPGKAGLVALSAALATFVSGAIAISLQGYSAEVLSAGIEVTNSVSPDDAHIAKDSGAKLDLLFKALHKQEIIEVNEYARKAKENIGLTTPVKAEVN